MKTQTQDSRRLGLHPSRAEINRGSYLNVDILNLRVISPGIMVLSRSLMVEPMDRNQQSSCRGRLAALRNTEKRRGLMNNISKREGDMAAGN